MGLSNMTLTNRLTLFHLVTLAVVLAAFAGSVYGLMRTILFRQLADQSTAALDTLVAAVEIEPNGLDWEPELRKIQFGGAEKQPAWAVFDSAGRRIDGGEQIAIPLADYASPQANSDQAQSEIFWSGQPWLVVRRTMHHPNPDAVRPNPRPGKLRHGTLVFVAAWPVAPLYRSLNTLLVCVAGGSLAIWLLAAGAGRWVSRRALAPVTSMANAVRQITIANLGERLALPRPHDELHELAASFNGLLTRLQESFERQRRFTGEASHQLRTPLSVMLGQIEVALRRERGPEEYRQTLATTHAQAERLRGIVEALLFLARADAEAGLPTPEPLELSNWLKEYQDILQSNSRHSDLRIHSELPDPTWVVAHRMLLEQSIDNLIDNACKYSKPGTPITVSLTREETHALLSVADKGCGIVAEDLTHVFEPFFRSAEARRRGINGFGLGLAVTARSVAAFGGHLEVSSQPGQGSKFSIRLPVAEPRAVVEVGKAQASESGQGSETIAEGEPLLHVLDQ